MWNRRVLSRDQKTATDGAEVTCLDCFSHEQRRLEKLGYFTWDTVGCGWKSVMKTSWNAWVEVNVNLGSHRCVLGLRLWFLSQFVRTWTNNHLTQNIMYDGSHLIPLILTGWRKFLVEKFFVQNYKIWGWQCPVFRNLEAKLRFWAAAICKAVFSSYFFNLQRHWRLIYIAWIQMTDVQDITSDASETMIRVHGWRVRTSR